MYLSETWLLMVNDGKFYYYVCFTADKSGVSDIFNIFYNLSQFINHVAK